MRKTLLYFFAFLTLHIQAEEKKLHVIQKTGNHISIPIANQPKIVFESGVMYVGNETFLASNVSKYLVGTDEILLTVKDVAKDGLRIDANDAANGKVQIENYQGQPIKMYDTSGMEIPCKMAESGTSVILDYSSLPTGTYVLSVGKENIKIQKR